MQRTRKRQYTAEFQAEAVNRVPEQKGLAEVARRLDLPGKSLANSVRAARAGKAIDEHFCNARPLHSSLGYASPRAFEHRYAARKAA